MDRNHPDPYKQTCSCTLMYYAGIDSTISCAIGEYSDYCPKSVVNLLISEIGFNLRFPISSYWANMMDAVYSVNIYTRTIN
jgi:hypothetical protein